MPPARCAACRHSLAGLLGEEEESESGLLRLPLQRERTADSSRVRAGKTAVVEPPCPSSLARRGLATKAAPCLCVSVVPFRLLSVASLPFALGHAGAHAGDSMGVGQWIADAPEETHPCEIEVESWDWIVHAARPTGGR